MDMNSEARAKMNRWRTTLKTAQRRAINFEERMLARLEDLRERSVLSREPLLEWQIQQVYFRDVGIYDPIDPEPRPIQVGDTWGGKGVSAFFRRQITIPESMDGQRIFLRIYVEGDSLVRLDGVPYHGLDPFRNNILLADSAHGGKTYDVELESYIHWYTSTNYHNQFTLAELASIDPEIEAAYWDFVAAFKVLFINNIDQNLSTFIETHLWNALRAIPIHEPDLQTFKTELHNICATFRENVFDTEHFKVNGLFYMVGHSHLDIVYQWPHREYIRKIGRTHSTMLRLMEQYPDFTFSQSNGKIYDDMKTHFPALYKEVKTRIAEGRWQPVGALWVESDCNLISGESLVRNILLGQRFWQDEFEFTSKIFWQPDVFGMTWALPQILKQSGIEIAFTNKPFVWNDTTPWRQNNFWWEGLDGSKVLGMIPPGHFIGFVDPDHMDQYWRDYSEKETIGEVIYTYGWGDGGGGVDPEMLECAKRYADFPGMVRTESALPEDALLRIADLAVDANLPSWRDEIYLEAHRGTYTTKGMLKKRNRQSEVLYRTVEMLATLAWLDGADYPATILDKGWKHLLATQFHDALPGTHINEVYHDLLAEYDMVEQFAQEVKQQAVLTIWGEQGQQLIIFNALPAEHAHTITLPADLLSGKSLAGYDGQALPHQLIDSFEHGKQVTIELDQPIPPTGYRVFEFTDDTTTSKKSDLRITQNTVENRYLKATFNNHGEIIRLYDKEASRMVLSEGERGNIFQIYEDRPGRYDAWDIVESYVEYELPIMGDSTISIEENGALRVALLVERTCYKSTIRQRISLEAESRHLTFETEIEWHERQRLLKVGFPLAIKPNKATFDIAYGNMERPTHRNTAHEKARFEVPAHWWMDMSEYNYGVALLNDCKYGHEVNEHWMRLTLLKGSVNPDPEADLGTHHFTYVLHPHIGGWREADVIGAAARLNTPLTAQSTNLTPNAKSFIIYDASNVTLEAVKRSEDDQYMIVRLVERHNALTHTTLTFDREFLAAYHSNVMEEIGSQLTLNGTQLDIELKPYEIVTIALKP